MIDLLERTAALVAVASVSRSEGALADLVQAELEGRRGLEVSRVGDNVVARTALGRPARVVLAGHLDTVPASGNATPRRDGDTLWGLGSADMKGGLAVMLELAAAFAYPAAPASAAATAALAVDVTWVFYAGEEIAREHNGLLAVEAAAPHLLEGDVAVLAEPTGAVVEAGCQGVLRLEVTMAGRRAHTARPWMGTNAVHRLGPVLGAVAAYQGRRPVLDGCRYREALQAVEVTGGVAANVVPDRASVLLSHRFAPDRDAGAAERAVRDLLAEVVDPAAGDRCRVVDVSPAAPPGLDHPILARLAAATGVPPRAKLGWTDVAFFAERGVPAVNFGPGDPDLAHTPDERVGRADLDRAYHVLSELLAGR